MRTINVHEAKTHLSRLLEDVAAGEEIVIAKAGRPIARLVPLASVVQERKLGRLAGKVWIADSFDDPLPRDILTSFES